MARIKNDTKEVVRFDLDGEEKTYLPGQTYTIKEKNDYIDAQIQQGRFTEAAEKDEEPKKDSK